MQILKLTTKQFLGLPLAKVAFFLFVFSSWSLVSAGDAGVWEAQGPGPMTQGQTENVTPNNEVVGAVNTVITHPSNPDIMWAGAVNGGIWRTDNATAASPNWVRQTDSLLTSQRSLSIGAMDLDPTDGTSNTLVAGIGRFSSFGRAGGNRLGVLKTTDGGTTWTLMPSNGLVGANISGIIVRGETIVVAVNSADVNSLSNTGIWRSTDGGNNFDQISSGNGATTGLPGSIAFDLVGDPSDDSVLYTVINFASLAGGTNGVFRSADTGASWNRVSDAAVDAALANENTLSLSELAVGTNNNVYVVICQNGRLSHLFRSGNGGTSWTSMDIPNPTVHPGSQGSLHLSIAAHPSNHNVVFVGGDRQDNPFPNSLGAENFSGAIWRCDASLAPGSQCVHATHSNSSGPSGGGTASNSSPHADSREMTFDAAGNLIETDDGGIYKRTSSLTNTGDWLSINGDLQATEFHSIAYERVNGTLMGGAQDTGSSFQLVAGMPTFETLFQGDGGQVQADDVSSPGFVVRYFSFQFLQSLSRAVYNDNNEFVSFTVVGRNVIGGPSIQPTFYTPIILNEVDPTRMVVLGGNGTFESFDQADNFTQISSIATHVSGSGTKPLAYGSQDNEDILYVGGTGSVFVRTGAPGSGLTQRNIGLGNGGLTIRDIALDPALGERVWAINSESVFQSTNAGQSWTEVTGNLGVVDIGFLRSIAFIPNGDDDLLVVGGDRGVYFSSEATGFTSWDVFGEGLPHARVLDLDYDATDQILSAGLLGRGAWKMMPVFGSACPLDLDQSGTVDATDLDLAVGTWPDDYDLNGDERVDVRDMVTLILGYGPCP